MADRGAGLAPVAALVFNALVWGLSWWPFRQFQAAGLHPLWTTVALYLLSLAVIVISKPSSRHGVLPSSRKAGCCWGVV